MTVAYLGTGLLGSAFVEAAVGRGEAVTVWNRTAEKARALAPLGVRVASTPADAVRDATRVHLVVTDDEVVERVLEALRPGLAAEAVILDHSTTLPARTAERVARLAASGVRYLHCPVFIGPAMARQSKGTILVSGPEDAYQVVRPALERMAEHVRYAGERGDLAAVYKLCGNAFIIGLNALLADVFALARGADVGADDALEILGLFNPASVIAGRGRHMIDREYAPSFELAMARKDVRLMLETAGSRPLAALPGIAARMDELIAGGHGEEDLAVMGVDSVAGATAAPEPRR